MVLFHLYCVITLSFDIVRLSWSGCNDIISYLAHQDHHLLYWVLLVLINLYQFRVFCPVSCFLIVSLLVCCLSIGSLELIFWGQAKSNRYFSPWWRESSSSAASLKHLQGMTGCRFTTSSFIQWCAVAQNYFLFKNHCFKGSNTNFFRIIFLYNIL